MNTAEFKKYGHQLVDWLGEYMDTLEAQRVQPSVVPGQIGHSLPESPPEQGESMDAILRDFRDLVLPGITHWQHPGWFAYFPSNSSPPSVLAEFLSAGLGTQCMSWNTSPAGTELEEVVMGWLREMIGLPDSWAGITQDTASTATLTALVSAREQITGLDINRRGFSGRLVVYTSDQAHSSVEKGAKIAGFGSDNVRLIETDEHFAMNPVALAQAMDADLAAGRIPTAVVATVGTTSSTGVDPVREIGQLCRHRGVWLHVDAAFAGNAAILPEMRWLLDGVELADSLVFNPHKWLMTTFDCSAYFVRQEAHLVQAFQMTPEYLKADVGGRVRNMRDWGIQLGRKFRGLKLWFVLRSYGVEGLRAVVRDHIAMAQSFAGWVRQSALFELLAPTPVSLVCFRFNDGRPEEALDTANRALLAAINQDGRFYLTHTVLRGKYTLRLAVGSHTTRISHVKDVWDLCNQLAPDL